MADSSFILSAALRPIGVAIAIGIIYGFMRLLWRFLPKGRIKQILFFRLWGKDNDPWNRPGAWQDAGPIGKHKDRTEPPVQAYLPPPQSPAVDPDSRLPRQ